jgi:hypothetical protein
MLAGCSPSRPPSIDPRPDIVLISLDTVRADRGPGPGGAGVMPSFAAFAATGVRFDAAWAPASNTLISHGSLFTGLEPWQHGFDPGRPPPVDPPPLMPALRQAGYATAVFTTLPIWLGSTHHFDVGAQTFRSELVPGEVALGWVRDWLATDPPRPRALFVHLYDAHSDTKTLPYEAPRLSAAAQAFSGCVGELCASRLLRAVDDGKVTLPDGAAEAIRAGYSDGVAAADALLGRLLTLLGPTARDGFVAVFSDHGELLGEEGWLHHGSSPAVLDIPLAVRWPGGPAGVVSHTPVTLVDLYPTVLEAAGVAAGVAPGPAVSPTAAAGGDPVRARSPTVSAAGGEPGRARSPTVSAAGGEPGRAGSPAEFAAGGEPGRAGSPAEFAAGAGESTGPVSRPGLRALVAGPASRRVLAMGAAREGDDAAWLARSGKVMQVRRGADGGWAPATVSPGLVEAAGNPVGSSEGRR